VIYDPQGEGTFQASQLHNAAGYTPYEGMRVLGRVKMTIARGQVVFEDGEFKGTPGRGQFIASEPFDPERFWQP